MCAILHVLFSLTKKVSNNAGFVVISSKCQIISAFRHINNFTYDRMEWGVSLLVLSSQRINRHIWIYITKILMWMQNPLIHLAFAVVPASCSSRVWRVPCAVPTAGDPTVCCVRAVWTASVTTTRVRHRHSTWRAHALHNCTNIRLRNYFSRYTMVYYNALLQSTFK